MSADVTKSSCARPRLTPPSRVFDEAYTATTQYVPWPKAYGGDMVAQAAAAAMRSVGEDRALHSMHSYFMRPVDIGAEVRYEVERLRDGRGYSTRQVRAFQGGKTVYVAMASFHVPEDRRGDPATAAVPAGIPDPESAGQSSAEAAQRQVERRLPPRTGRGAAASTCGTCPGAVYLSVEGEQVPHQAVWVKAVRPASPDDHSDLQRAALAYVVRLHHPRTGPAGAGSSWGQQGLVTASLDHAMWFHRDGRVDDWLLYVQEAVSAQASRGLGPGPLLHPHGRLLATVAQEGMIRMSAP